VLTISRKWTSVSPWLEASVRSPVVRARVAAALHRQGLTLVRFSAQPEPCLSLKLNNCSLKKC